MRQKEKLSKTAFWTKWEFFDLLDDLKKANAGLKEDEGLDLKGKEKFQLLLEDKIDDIECGNQTDLTEIWNWFSPRGQWIATMGLMNEELRETIFKRADAWKKGQQCTIE